MFTIEYNDFIPIQGEVRNWVLIPLFFITICSNFLRTSISQLMNKKKEVTPRKQQENTILQKANLFIERSHLLFRSVFGRIQNKYVNNEDGILRISQAPQEEGAMQMPQMDPMTMMSGMGGGMINNVIYIVIYSWISSTFGGFIVLKLPFQLSYRLKLLTQQGLLMMNLEPCYVSSMCWYFLIIYCGNYIVRLFNINAEMDPMMMTGMAQPQQQVNPMAAMGGVVKSFNDAANNMAVLKYSDDFLMEVIENEVYDDVEKRVSGKVKSD